MPEKNAATTGLSPTNFTPQYHDIDCRLLDGYRESREFLPYKIAIQKALSRDGLEQTRVTIPVDTSKRRHVEAAITARGLTLLSEYPVTNQLLFYAKDQVILAIPRFWRYMLTCMMFSLKQGGIMEPIVCVTNFRGYKPEEYFDRSDRVFRWSFIFVSGNGEVHQWNPEGCGFCIGKWDNVDVEKVVRFAADWISGGVESEDGSEQDSDGSN